MKILCNLGIHKWTLLFSTYSHIDHYKYFHQGKKCAKCAKYKN